MKPEAINLTSNLNIKRQGVGFFYFAAFVAFQKVLDEALLNLATGVTSSVMTEPNLKASACSCEVKI